MEKEYLIEIIRAAKLKLLAARKPLSELELIAGIVSSLKKKVGKDDMRHSSKSRFKKDFFTEAIESKEWQEKIIQISIKTNKRFILKAEVEKYAPEDKNDIWHWREIAYENAIQYKLQNLKNIDPYKLEKLVSYILNKIFSEFNFKETRKSGDGGIDVIGVSKKEDIKEAVYVQVKRYSGTLSREKANEFHGTILDLKRQKKYKKITGFYITTGSFSAPFEEFLNKNEIESVKYSRWNGEELAKQMLKHGLGVKYSIDTSFWREVDSAAVLKSKTGEVLGNKNKLKKSKNKLKKQG